MTCGEFQTCVHAYVDGELPVTEVVAADAHAVHCAACADLLRREREFRHLLRRQPREPAPTELRAAIVARLRRQRRSSGIRHIFAVALPAAAAVLVVVFLAARPQNAALLGELVDKHIAYAQVDAPAELASSDPDEIRQWFHQRAALSVTVPDYSPAGIRLVGGRLAEAHEHKAAHLLYEKGRTLLSVFIVPVSERDAILRGDHVAYRGHQYVTIERKGYHTVSWSEGRVVFGLVSMLDYEALLECADRLRTDDASRGKNV